MIRALDLLMKINVILCIVGLIAIKSGFLDRFKTQAQLENLSGAPKAELSATVLP